MSGPDWTEIRGEDPHVVRDAIDALEHTLATEGPLSTLAIMYLGEHGREPTRAEVAIDLIRAAGAELTRSHGCAEFRDGNLVLVEVRDRIARAGGGWVAHAGQEVMREVIRLATESLRAHFCAARRAVAS